MSPLGRTVFLVSTLITLSGCYSLPLATEYDGPPERPHAIADYYPADEQPKLSAVTEERREGELTVTRHELSSSHGAITVTLYEKPANQAENVVLVFPVLGGKKNLIEGYFAKFLAENGINAGIVKRSDEFKKPENFDRLEELMRENVIRDRLALNYLETAKGVKNFGAFGISRGAINVAMTAGADPRLAYNVMFMGGSDIATVFEQTDQPRARMIIRKIATKRKVEEATLIEEMRRNIKTDPKYLARYIDARRTLLILARFDHTVPFNRGMSLRRELGYPETILLASGHYSSAMFTGIAHDFAPLPPMLPPSYVEAETLRFFQHHLFTRGSPSLSLGVMRVLRAPLNVLGRAYHALVKDKGTRNVQSPFEGSGTITAATSQAISR
jgi:hypothetical protein